LISPSNVSISPSNVSPSIPGILISERMAINCGSTWLPAALVLRLYQMVHTTKPIVPAVPATGSCWSVVGVNLSSVSEH
jgi:hypothetical protein